VQLFTDSWEFKVIYHNSNALLSFLEKGLWNYFAPHYSHRMQCDKAAFT
jgi:hypothetical protein